MRATKTHCGVGHSSLRGHESRLGTPTLKHNALAVLHVEVLASLLATLGQGNIQGLALKHAAVHLRQGTGGLLLSGEADESESTGVSLVVNHNTRTGDGAELFKALTQLVVVEVLQEVLHVKVDTTGLVGQFLAVVIVLTAQPCRALLFLHGTADVNRATIDFLNTSNKDELRQPKCKCNGPNLAVELSNGGLGVVGISKFDKAEAAGLGGIDGVL